MITPIFSGVFYLLNPYSICVFKDFWARQKSHKKKLTNFAKTLKHIVISKSYPQLEQRF
jgi:hypothetical protein